MTIVSSNLSTVSGIKKFLKNIIGVINEGVFQVILIKMQLPGCLGKSSSLTLSKCQIDH